MLLWFVWRFGKALKEEGSVEAPAFYREFVFQVDPEFLTAQCSYRMTLDGEDGFGIDHCISSIQISENGDRVWRSLAPAQSS